MLVKVTPSFMVPMHRSLNFLSPCSPHGGSSSMLQLSEYMWQLCWCSYRSFGDAAGQTEQLPDWICCSPEKKWSRFFKMYSTFGSYWAFGARSGFIATRKTSLKLLWLMQKSPRIVWLNRNSFWFNLTSVPHFSSLFTLFKCFAHALEYT